jgi:hypothetical protein
LSLNFCSRPKIKFSDNQSLQDGNGAKSQDVRWSSYGMWRRVAWCISTDVSDELSAISVYQITWCYIQQYRSRGTSVSIVSGYGLDDRAIDVRSSAEARDFSSNLCVQTGSGAHPASCIMDIGGPYPGGEARSGHDADHSPPSSAEVVNE